GHPVMLHQKAQHRTVRPAAEAVVELLVGAHPEGGRFFAVKRAAGLVLAAGLLKRYPQANDLDDIRARDQLVDEALRDASHRLDLGAWLTHVRLLRPPVSASFRRSFSLHSVDYAR